MKLSTLIPIPTADGWEYGLWKWSCTQKGNKGSVICLKSTVSISIISNENWLPSPNARNTTGLVLFFGALVPLILLKCYTRSGWAIWDSSTQGHTEGEQMKTTLPRAGPLEGLSSGSWTMMRPWRGWQRRTAAACSQSQEMLELLWLGFWSSVIVYEITNTKQWQIFQDSQSTDTWNLYKVEFLSRKMISLDLQNFIDLVFLPELYFLIFKVYIATNFPLGNDWN